MNCEGTATWKWLSGKWLLQSSTCEPGCVETNPWWDGDFEGQEISTNCSTLEKRICLTKQSNTLYTGDGVTLEKVSDWKFNGIGSNNFGCSPEDTHFSQVPLNGSLYDIWVDATDCCTSSSGDNGSSSSGSGDPPSSSSSAPSSGSDDSSSGPLEPSSSSSGDSAPSSSGADPSSGSGTSGASGPEFVTGCCANGGSLPGTICADLDDPSWEFLQGIWPLTYSGQETFAGDTFCTWVSQDIAIPTGHPLNYNGDDQCRIILTYRQGPFMTYINLDVYYVITNNNPGGLLSCGYFLQFPSGPNLPCDLPQTLLKTQYICALGDADDEVVISVCDGSGSGSSGESSSSGA